MPANLTPPQTRNERPYDIIVFGATGFTGQLTAEYLAAQEAKEGLRWALAGRSLARLEKVRQIILQKSPKASPELVICDANDSASLEAMVRQTQVMITTVGPYLNYGEPLVKACVEAGTHYVDLSGEPEFVDKMIYLYDEIARENQTKIVNCCGFDSIPHDLGALFTINALNQLIGNRAGTIPVTVEGYVTAKGVFSGGTWHSAIHQFARVRSYYQRRKTWIAAFRSRAQDHRTVKMLAPRIAWIKAFNRYACTFPTIDPQVVCRSARVYPKYGSEFRYGHHVLAKSPFRLAAGIAVVSGLFTLAQWRPTRELLLKQRNPGQGPDEATRARSWFQVKFIGRAGGMHVWTQVSGGDPGYGETAKMLAESALCLVRDQAQLPHNFGVITPATAMGERLIERLQSAGIAFSIL
ncbi:Hypothetical protein HDN1F_32990 [gamma proteobacterium HdN1]|nr:Hypothetical protein HDN1F_32990 [gamma proteobacterium HdN1]